MNYFANTGTPANPSFNFPTSFPFGFTYLNSSFAVHFVDLDGDGDKDLVAGGTYGQLDYYENTGSATSPAFGTAVPNPFGLDSLADVSNPEFGDLDGDGDMDLMLNDGSNNWIYRENTGSATAPAFGPAVTNPFGLGGGFQAYYEVHTLGDLDQDGDLDIYSSLYDGSHRYFENIGTPTSPSFANPTLNPFGLQPWTGQFFPDLVDLDGDGDLDLLGSEYAGGEWFYYENNSLVSTDDPNPASISLNLFPNPASDQLNLTWKAPEKPGPVRIQLLDLTGRVIHSEDLGIRIQGSHMISLANFSAGMYLIQLDLGDRSAREPIMIR